MRQAVFVHLAGGSEPVSYSWTFSAAGTAVGTVAAYSGVDPVTPIDAHDGQVTSSSASITAPSITTTAANTMLVDVSLMVGKTTIGPPATMTERIEVVSPGGVSSKLTQALADALQAGIGPTGTRVATGGSSAHNIGALIALRPD